MEQESYWQFCNECGKYNNHVKMHSESVNNDAYDKVFECMLGWHKGYCVYRCLGCNEFFTEYWKWFSGHNMDDVIRTRFPAKKILNKPDWCVELTDELSELLTEIYRAIQYDCLTLACIGIRTVLERVFVDKLGDIGDTKTKLNKMVEEKHFNSDEKAVISTVYELGSASSHRAHVPKLEDLKKALSIMEHLLHRTYVQTKYSADIKENTPRRKMP